MESGLGKSSQRVSRILVDFPPLQIVAAALTSVQLLMDTRLTISG